MPLADMKPLMSRKEAKFRVVLRLSSPDAVGEE